MNRVFVNYYFNGIFPKLFNINHHKAINVNMITITIAITFDYDNATRSFQNFFTTWGYDSYLVRETLIIIPRPFGYDKKEWMLNGHIRRKNPIKFSNNCCLSPSVYCSVIAQM